MDRIKLINQKRSTLKSQLTNLENAVAENRLDPANVKLRLKRVTELFHAYEELHDEFAILDPENERSNEFDEIQDRYYALASRDEVAAGLSTSAREAELNVTSLVLDKSRRVKLPVTELEKFDGHLEQWLSFKNTFTTMIHSRDDITDLQKFLYLKRSLGGDALNKIAIYNVSGEKYGNAWRLLIDSYEKRRILISKHLDSILDLPAQDKATPKNLTKLADDMRQHVNMLASLDVVPDEHLLVRVLERALPMETRTKWEESLDLDVTPTLAMLYKFLSETAFRLMTIEQNFTHSKSDNNNKRRYAGQETSQPKTRRTERGARALISATSGNCSVCKGETHPLYRCSVFRKLPTAEKWETVKKSKLCRNCLGTHDGKCISSRCRACGRFHHMSLHYTGKESASRHSPQDHSIKPESAPPNAPSQSK